MSASKKGKDSTCSDEVGAAVAQAQANVPSGKPNSGEAPSGESGQTKRKSKSERRAEQKAAREVKKASKSVAKEPAAADKKQKTTLEGSNAPKRVPSNIQVDDKKQQAKVAKKLAKQQAPPRTEVQKQVKMFSHLHQFKREVSLTAHLSFASGGIHPAILKLGLQYADGKICGSNARCFGLLGAFQQVVKDYETPVDKALSRDLDNKIKPYITFLSQCRPLSVGMGNAIKQLKLMITQIPLDMPEEKAKAQLQDTIDRYMHEKIVLADKAISQTYAQTKISDGDVILTFACSSIVIKVLKDAHNARKKFRVIVVDSRPKMEGRECMRRLVQHGIPCSYILLNALSYVMKEVSKVFLGAHALLANGYVMSRVGTSMVALVASSYNVPVLVCCETYKCCDRVQTDSFVFNELGDPEDLAGSRSKGKSCGLEDWRDIQQLNVLNLVYDVTPPDFITMVITEVGMIPCTSVPVVLRVKSCTP